MVYISKDELSKMMHNIIDPETEMSELDLFEMYNPEYTVL